jgi:hypothetical protein
LRDAVKRRETEADLECRNQEEHQRENAEGDGQRAVELARLFVDFDGIPGDGHEKPTFVAKVDRPLDHAQLLLFRAGHVALAQRAGHVGLAGVGQSRQAAVP